MALQLTSGSLSERQQLAAIIVGIAAVLSLLWFLALAPQMQKRRKLEAKIKQIEADLRRDNYDQGEEPLRAKMSVEEARSVDLLSQWETVNSRFATYSNQSELARSQVGNIDFKLQHFEVSKRLARKAREAGIDLPERLGMIPVVFTDDEARDLLLQLRAVERLVDLIFKLGIPEVVHVEPRPAVQHMIPGTDTPFMEDHPVQLRFKGTMQNVEDLLHAAMGPEHVFAFRHLRIEKETPMEPDLLDVHAVISAILFYRGPEDLSDLKVERELRKTARGM